MEFYKLQELVQARKLMKYVCVLLIAILLTGCASPGTHAQIDLVKIDAAGTTYLNGKQMPVASLSKSFKKDEVVIDADLSLPHSKLAAVMEETKKAGIKKVSVKTRSTKK